MDNSYEIQQLKNCVLAMSQSISAMVTVEGMKAANYERMSRNEALAYSEEAFEQIQMDVGWNSIMGILNREI